MSKSGRTAFTLKPFSRVSNRSAPPTAKSFDRSFDRASSSSFGPDRPTFSQIPQTGQEVGKISLSAAREGVVSKTFWQALLDRALQLEDLEPQDIAYLLNGMTRVRMEVPNEFFEEIVPKIETKLAYFSSIHLAMLFSAISKNPSLHSSPFVPVLSVAVGRRAHEFATPVELAMVLAALARFKTSDRTIWCRFSQLVQTRMDQHHLFFPIRELVILATSFSGYEDSRLFEKIAEQAISQISDATPAELGRLIIACKQSNELKLVAEETLLRKLRYLSPIDLVACIQIWPPEEKRIHCALFDTFLATFSLFQMSQVADILNVYSRWHLVLTTDQSEILDSKLLGVSDDRFDDSTLVSVCGYGKTKFLFAKKNRIFSIISAHDIDTKSLLRAMQIYSEIDSMRSELKTAISGFVLKKKLDKRTQNSLKDILLKFCSPEDDLM